MQEPISLLIVDDESAMRRVIRTPLQALGYDTDEAPNGERAIELLRRRPFDLVLLDINMPGMGGLEACRRIREMAAATGIVIVSVRDKEEDMVRALESGADDYVTKPFRLRELLARLRAVRRRTRADQASQAKLLRAGDLELDVVNRMLRKAGVEVHLSQKEFDILSYLMNHADTPVPHARLLQAVWGPEYGGETEYLRTYIRHLRRKIEHDAANPTYLLTEPWLGYRFRNPDDLQDTALAPVA